MRLRWLLITATLIGWWTFITHTEKISPTLTQINSQAGLYFDEIGQILFYTTQWKIVSYADLKPVQLQWRQVKEHQMKIGEYCMKVKNETWYNLTDCHAFASCVWSKIKYVDQLKDIIADYLSTQPIRTKRDFGFWRGHFKILIWNLDTVRREKIQSTHYSARRRAKGIFT